MVIGWAELEGNEWLKSLFHRDAIIYVSDYASQRVHYDWLDWASDSLLGAWWYWPGMDTYKTILAESTKVREGGKA